MDNSAVAYRILDPKTTLTGGAESLQNVLVDPLPDGAVCWVIAENGFWYLSKSSLAAVNADVIATARGALARGRWIRVGTAPSSTEAAFAQIALTSGPFTLDSGAALWQAMPTSETTYSVISDLLITITNATFSVPVDEPSGNFLARAVLSWTGSDTEDTDVLGLELAISKNGQLIGTSDNAATIGGQVSGAVYIDTLGQPTLTVVSERVVDIAPGDTVEAIVLPTSPIGNASVNVLAFTLYMERLTSTV